MRTDRVLTRVLSGVAVSALLVTLAACGGGDTETAEESPGSDTASSAPAESEESPEVEEAEPTDEEGASGGYDSAALLDAMKAAIADNESAHVTMEMTGGGQAMSGEGDVSYAGDSTSMQMTMQIPQMGGGDMEMRMLGGVMYMSIPPMTPTGKFIKIDTNDPNSPFGDLGGVSQGDPLATFDAFDAGLQEAEYVGVEDVDGEQLDHYLLTVDAKKAAKAQGQPYQQGMPETITYDMWIDDSDLMRRIEFDLGAFGGDAAGAGGMVMTMSDWGKPVSVKAPPANAIVEMPGAPTG
ncbi:MAG: LppX_LprAFG lipoprotein [Nocardioides sp.]